MRAAMVFVVGLTISSLAWSFRAEAADCYLSDSPGCTDCFDNTGSWDPGGRFIQKTAEQTLGTRESCPPDDGGKAFYQMRLGINSPHHAQVIAAWWQWIVNTGGTWPLDLQREWWCSEGGTLCP